MSNSLDPDQAKHFVRPDLGPNCLQRLSAAILVGKAKYACRAIQCEKKPYFQSESVPSIILSVYMDESFKKIQNS